MEREIKREQELMEVDRKKTILEKQKFIKEIKYSLGEEIKKEPNKKQEKPSLFRKFLRLLFK